MWNTDEHGCHRATRRIRWIQRPCDFVDVDETKPEGERETPLEDDTIRRRSRRRRRRRKPRTKTKSPTETRRRRRPEKSNACLPQANQIRWKSRRSSQMPRRRIPRKRRRNPAAKGTLVRSYLVWALRPGAGLHAVWSTPPHRKRAVLQAPSKAPSIESARLLNADSRLLYKSAIFVYPWSFSVPRHDVPRFLLAQKRREETKDVFIAPKMRPSFGCLQVIWVSGSSFFFLKAQIKILGTPLLLNFKILGGHSPRPRILSTHVRCIRFCISACCAAICVVYCCASACRTCRS